jgi:hypothetical protein
MQGLKDLYNDISADAPMRVVSFKTFKQHGKLPRSSDKVTQAMTLIPGEAIVIFISHRWLRPWKTQHECEGEGHVWAGMSHPDDHAGSKHLLICAAVQKLAKEKKWLLNQVFLWLDFCCVEQDDARLLLEGVKSLRGYISVCDAMLIPSPEVPAEDDERTVDRLGRGYGDRAWTRLESMSFYAVSGTPVLTFAMFTF